MNLISQLIEPQKIKVHFDDNQGTNKLEARLQNIFKKAKPRPLIILCVGTDRSTGDSLGPLIGTKLISLGLPQLYVLGTLDQPVHATNLVENLEYIKNSFINPYIIAIDACLGKLDSVGHITFAEGPLRPGAGVNKNLPAVGEVHLTGIVNVGGFMEYMVLQNTRLSLVWKMADRISEVISQAYVKTRF